MYETVIAETWLKEVLTGSAELAALVGDRVYAYLAPQDAAYPFVVFELAPGQDTHDTVALGARRVKTSLGYSVVAVGKTNSFASLDPIAEQIDAILHGKSGNIPEGQIISCIRKAPVAKVELDEFSAMVYRHLGGLFEVQVQKAAGG